MRIRYQVLLVITAMAIAGIWHDPDVLKPLGIPHVSKEILVACIGAIVFFLLEKKLKKAL